MLLLLLLLLPPSPPSPPQPVPRRILQRRGGHCLHRLPGARLVVVVVGLGMGDWV